jgi:WhiB family transcriptional regulator, redox-sensing transcriptional regulator
MTIRLWRRTPPPAVVGDLPCRTNDPDLWFSDSPAEQETARSLCGACPVRAECLASAIERAEPWGVWGGEIFDGGAVVPRKRPRGRPRKSDLAPPPQPIRAAPRARPVRWAGRLAGMAAQVLPAEHRARYQEEFAGELYELAEAGAPRRRQLAHALRLVDRAWILRAELRVPVRVRP